MRKELAIRTSIPKERLFVVHRLITESAQLVPWEQGRLVVPTEPTPWPSDRLERVSVNSFGVGGANAQ